MWWEGALGWGLQCTLHVDCTFQANTGCMSACLPANATNERAAARQCIAVLCGLPGAGKTTFCRNLMRSCATPDLCVTLLCFDATLRDMAKACSDPAGFSPRLWKVRCLHLSPCCTNSMCILWRHIAWLQAARGVFTQQLVHMLQSPCERRQLILVDDNHHYRCLASFCLSIGSQTVCAAGMAVTDWALV